MPEETIMPVEETSEMPAAPEIESADMVAEMSVAEDMHKEEAPAA